MVNLVQATLIASILLLVLFCGWSKADPEKELLCCYGRSDAVANMMVTKHQFSKSTSCRAHNQCEDSNCTIEYLSLGPLSGSGKDTDDADEEKAERQEDCFKWTPANEFSNCLCEKNYCNCPDALRNQQPKPKPPGLQCCDNYFDKPVEKVTCPETTLPQPQGCTAQRYRDDSVIAKCGLGTQFSDNCSEYVANNPVGPLQGQCYCQKDFCNCPLRTQPTTTTPKSTTTTKPGNSQIKNYAPKIPFVLLFFLLVALK